MDNRTYMLNIAYFLDWCYLRKVNPDIVNESIINAYIDSANNKEEAKEALLKYKSYIK
ncbi:hypothetical protein [Clostridium perfringens]|uniref:hypothetical protein n=1 Tax=Clostridium perfringens TaxID=1502 RepID=UPI0013E2E391|nr:hypothetical protein [Clostridium perfringens]NGT04433.1 hypothetical protein [Clostridium perfringens]